MVWIDLIIMRKVSIVILALAAVMLAGSALGQTKYRTYSNARFAYSVDYPIDLLTPQDEAQNGDGRVFLAKRGSAELRVWGQYNALFDTLKKAYLSDLKERGTGVTYKALFNDSYVISGTKGGKVYYQKTILSGTDGDAGATFATFVIQYNKSEKAKLDPVAAKISRSFKFE